MLNDETDTVYSHPADDPVRSSINGGINEHSFKLRVYAERTGLGNGVAPYSINCSLCYNILSKSMKH